MFLRRKAEGARRGGADEDKERAGAPALVLRGSLGCDNMMVWACFPF